MSLYDSGVLEITTDDGGNNNFSKITQTLNAGIYFVKITSYSSITTISTYNLTLLGTHIVDPYEPNNDKIHAQPLFNNATSHALNITDTEDWFTLTLGTDSTVIFETNGTSGDTGMNLYDTSLTLLTSDDGGNGLFSKITQTLSSGRYFIQVVEYSSEDLNYTMHVSGASFADYYEPNNDPTEATQLTDGVSYHRINSDTDKDWIEIIVDKKSTVSFETFGTVGDTNINLYDHSLNFITDNDDQVNSSFSKITQPLNSGRYYLKINEVGSLSNYSYAQRIIGRDIIDIFEPNNNIFNATKINNGTSYHTIDSIGDEDWFKVSVIRPSTVTFETNGTSGDTVMELYDTSLTLLTSDDDGGNKRFSKITQTLDMGIYYIKVNELNNNTIDYYTMQISGLAESIANDFDNDSISDILWRLMEDS